MDKERGNVYCRFEFENYEQELTIPLTSLTEGQIRGATDLFLKFLRQKFSAKAKTEERET